MQHARGLGFCAFYILERTSRLLSWLPGFAFPFSGAAFREGGFHTRLEWAQHVSLPLTLSWERLAPRLQTVLPFTNSRHSLRLFSVSLPGSHRSLVYDAIEAAEPQ